MAGVRRLRHADEQPCTRIGRTSLPQGSVPEQSSRTSRSQLVESRVVELASRSGRRAGGARQRLLAPPRGDLARGGRTAALGHVEPAPGAAWCRRGTRAARRAPCDSSVSDSGLPRTRAAAAPPPRHHQRGHLAAGQHVVADARPRRPASGSRRGRGPAGRCPRSGRRRRPATAAAASSLGDGLGERPPGGRRHHQRRRRRSRRRGTSASSASPHGSGRITMPAPPPYGVSSTVRCRSWVQSRRSCTRRSSRPASCALPEQRQPQRREVVGEDRDDVDAHGSAPSSGSGRRAARAGGDPSRPPATSTSGTSARTNGTSTSRPSAVRTHQQVLAGAVDARRRPRRPRARRW